MSFLMGDRCPDHSCDYCSVCQAGVCCGAVAQAPLNSDSASTQADNARKAFTLSLGEHLLTLVRVDAAQQALHGRITRDSQLLIPGQLMLPSTASLCTEA